MKAAGAIAAWQNGRRVQVLYCGEWRDVLGFEWTLSCPRVRFLDCMQSRIGTAWRYEYQLLGYEDGAVQ